MGIKRKPLVLYFVGDGRRLPIANLLDIDGNDTADPRQAFSCVAMLPDGKWLAIQCRDGDIIASNAHS